MALPRILNLEPEGYSSQARAILAKCALLEDGPRSRTELIAEIHDYDAIIVRLAHQIDLSVMDAAPKLRVIATATTALDHIDVEEARRRGITIVSLKAEYDFLRSIPATSELTWGLILSLTRRLPAAVAETELGKWNRDDHIGVDLAGRTLGLIGLGRIGERVARYAAAFDMSVVAYDPFRIDWPKNVRRAESLAALAVECDILSIHVPLEASTENLIDRKVFSLMRRGSYFVNTSRGRIVNEVDLLEALESARLAGAALDVYSDERSGKFAESHMARMCRKYPNLIMTPHIGGASADSMRATELFVAHKLLAVLIGGIRNEST